MQQPLGHEKEATVRCVPRRCPVCGGNSTATLFENRIAATAGFDFSSPIVRCTSCGTAYAGNALLPFELNRYYRNLSKYDTVAGPQNIPPLDRERAALAVKFLAPIIGSVSNVLDVGCSSGAFLSVLRDAGVKNAQGIDPAEHAPSAARRLFDISVTQADAEAYDQYGNYDLVCLMAVVEHLRDPIKLLRKIGRQLRPNGRLLIEVPDAGAFDRIGDTRQFEPFGEFSNEHINFLSITNLRQLGLAAGLEVERWQPWRVLSGAPGMFVLLRPAAAPVALPGPDVGSTESRFSSDDSLKNYIARSKLGMQDVEKRLANTCGGKILIYGAGNHTGRLLAQSPSLAASEVLAVFDRNRLLHGERIGDSQILPPTALHDFPPLPVIISTFNARHDIYRSLRAVTTQPLILLYD